ncbi:hypothetical protein CVM73_00310 [Bradyrhizobium forestalis]|uniref:Uncharacterized protein n=1 Tax=Bradyrhizobium forestalis TaxID=1419263 RepID=A0A2M8RGG0_9BRAD|nr:hypothetical protein CVM73_00310 [Bradyrhizobium forestalis]
MQVIYSNPALDIARARCPAENLPALFDVIAQLMQNNLFVRNNPERYDTESNYFEFSIQDPRWTLIIARAYVSAMIKTGPIWNRTYVGTQVMVIGFQ